MQTAHFYALVTVSILVMALTAVMMEGAPASDTVSVEALRIEATTTSTPTRALSNPEATTTTTTVIQIEPDTDALGNPVGDLHPTTTTTAPAADHSSATQTAKA
ncbi:MAG: hypothetical protein WCA93_05850, partial [Acidimicrobiia bacterium]